jgi:hypothetical protein
MQTSISLQEGPRGLHLDGSLKNLTRRPDCAAANCARSMPETPISRQSTPRTLCVLLDCQLEVALGKARQAGQGQP